MTRPSVNPSQLTFLAGGGEMGARMREMDWSNTPLGPPAAWPQSLRSTVSMLLPSKAQIVLFWGSEFIVLYNDAYRPVFGAKHPDALGRPGREAWSEIWDSQLHPLLQGVVQTGEAFWARDLLFGLERYGFLEETYFDVSYDPVRVETGTVGGVFCIVTETTERVVGERQLALLRDLAARNATARTERDACVLTMETLAGTPDVAFALAYLDDELQAATPDGELRLAETKPDLVKTLSIPSSTSSRAGRLIVGINPRRPFDDGYRSFLDLVVDQLAIALTNARAYEAERQRAEALAEIDRAKTTFFSNVSHEFRTPLTLLVGPLEDALADAEAAALPAGQRERVETAHRNALRLLRLVNTLLDFSRIEAGRIDASYEPTDLAALTADLASAFRSAIEKAGLTLVVDCPSLREPVYVDRDMWEKIVLNLLSNAFKFTFEGEIRVELRMRDDRVELRVADTGVGIPAADLERMFERFHRIRHARARTHEGTGIGLALVQELARLHGGDVTVDSQEGRGSTFTVSIRTGTSHLPADRISAARQLTPTSTGVIPYVEEALRWMPDANRPDANKADVDRRPGAFAESVAAKSVAAPSASGDKSDVGRDAARVLIADDNADMRDYLARMLGQHYRVDVVADGRAALNHILADPPDLVLTDVMMPTLDGFGLLAAVRGDERIQSMPIILLSARAGEEARIEGLQAGADEYLVKPFGARELLACVASQLQLARLRRESERALRHQNERFQEVALENARLYQSAQEASRIKDEFLASLSHELRTPLNAILGYARMLRSGIIAHDKTDKAIETIERNATSLTQIVEDVLDISRIVSGKIRLDVQPIEFPTVVRNAIDAIAPAAEARGVRIETAIDLESGPISGDPERLQQVLWNLLSNAVKFTTRGGMVQVRLEHMNSHVELSVTDTGIGISPKFLPHVFERFRQEDAGITRERGGLGLGLAIAKQLTELHGGTIEAFSAGLGQGAAFHVKIPVRAIHSEPRAV